MKRYIWLTMYFIWLVLISYTFFYYSSKDNLQKDVENPTKENISQTQKENQEIQKQNIENQDEKNNTENQTNIENISWDFVRAENLENWELKQKQESIFMTIEIWDETLNLIEDKSQETLYEILWVTDFPTYKTNEKEIYIKKLKSIEYEDKKDNIERLIQRIWENIVNSNLFGEKQLFVNIKWYYKSTSIMLVKYQWETYIVVFPYEKYENYKKFFEEVLFIN